NPTPVTRPFVGWDSGMVVLLVCGARIPACVGSVGTPWGPFPFAILTSDLFLGASVSSVTTSWGAFPDFRVDAVDSCGAALRWANLLRDPAKLHQLLKSALNRAGV